MSETICDCNRCRIARGAHPYHTGDNAICSKPVPTPAEAAKEPSEKLQECGHFAYRSYSNAWDDYGCAGCDNDLPSDAIPAIAAPGEPKAMCTDCEFDSCGGDACRCPCHRASPTPSSTPDVETCRRLRAKFHSTGMLSFEETEEFDAALNRVLKSETP